MCYLTSLVGQEAYLYVRLVGDPRLLCRLGEVPAKKYIRARCDLTFFLKKSLPYFLDEYRDGLGASVVLEKTTMERYFFQKKFGMLFVFHLDAEVNAAEVVLRESLEKRKKAKKKFGT